MVFQHYALFRYMSAAENIEFPLRIRRTPAAERRRRRDELLELVGLAGFGARMPAQLSGGQQQRVALARALAHKPEVLLLDEPFGALDAKIRAELRRTILAIQHELGVTTIFVTHDQDEAFELADHLGIMNHGRLLEVGPPRELYLRPQTEFVATFLGAANLMVGECTPEGVRLGHIVLPLGTEMAAVAGARRVQVLFRPEDVAVKDSSEALSAPLLGEGIVEETSFAGSFERLRLRLPPLAGVRSISPPAPFGVDWLPIDAIRSQHLARQHPLRAGDAAWVGVRRMHALSHPGLSILLAGDGSAGWEDAMALGGSIARVAQAGVTMLVYGHPTDAANEWLRRARVKFGDGLAGLSSASSPDGAAAAIAAELARKHYDLVVAAPPPSEPVRVTSELLEAGDHNLLLVPRPSTVPKRVLICVAVGEPSKENVRIAGRLVRHLRAEATVMTVLSEEPGDIARLQAERFLAAARRTLSLLGVSSRSEIRLGDAREEILKELADGGYELLVMGAPLIGSGTRATLGELLGGLVAEGLERPLLITRSRHAAHSKGDYV
jgi:ABC-type Fe3+/spermidine/putrescine transport system ATPase subunit